MKKAFIIVAHDNVHVIKRNIDKIIQSNDNYVYLHFNKLSKKEDFLLLKNYFINNQRVKLWRKFKTHHGGFSIVKTKYFLTEKCINSKIDFDYVSYITGDHYLLKSNSNFDNFLQKHWTQNFTNQKLFFSKIDNFINDNAFYNIHLSRSNKACKSEKNSKLDISLILFNLLYKNIIISKIKGDFFITKCFNELTRGFPCCTLYFKDILKIHNDPITKKFYKEMKYIFSPCEVFYNSLVYNLCDNKILDNCLEYSIWYGNMTSPALLDNKEFNIMKNKKLDDIFFCRKVRDIQIAALIDSQYK